MPITRLITDSKEYCFGAFEKQKLLLCACKTALELIQTSAGIDKLLLAGKERMALGADFNGHIAFGRTSLNLSAASTSDRAFFVFGMESFLHVCTPHFLVNLCSQ